MSKLYLRIQNLLGDRAVLLLIVAASAAFSMAYLIAWTDAIGARYDVLPQWFAPSVMLAGGRGFVKPAPSEVPALDEFLQQKRMELLLGQLPAEIPTVELEPFHVAHQYLLYAVAATWWAFGISWDTLKVLLVIVFCVTVAIVYGLFRLGMNRLLSLIGALLFATTPLVLAVLPSIRDFCKAPFVLGAILIIGYLIKKPVKAPALWGLAALLGLVIGVGMGFRQDLLVFALPGLVVLAFGARVESRYALLHRLVAIALLLVCFAVPAWPLQKSGGHPGFTHITMGFSTRCEDDLGLARAWYERLYQFNDFFAYATLNSYGRRVNGWTETVMPDSPESQQAGKQLYLDVARTFPADMITRGYAAVLRVLKDPRVRLGALTRPDNPFIDRLGKLHSPLAMHLAKYSIYYAITALLLLSCHSLRMAWLALLLLLYFCSYVNLEFQLRHCFHLCFVPIWLAGFVIDKVVFAAPAQVLFRGKLRETGRVALSPGQWWAPPVRRMVQFGISASILIFVPLYSARAYQYYAIGKTLDKYEAAHLEPLEVEEIPLDDWVLFHPVARPEPESDTLDRYECNYETDYLVVELATSTESLPISVRYRSGLHYSGFPEILDVAPTGANEEGTAKYFFPVYEIGLSPVRSVFEGVALPREHAGKFRGLYRVSNIEDFSLLMNLCLPADRAFFRRYQTLAREVEVFERLGIRYEREGFPEAVTKAYRLANALDPSDPAIQARLGRALVREGDFENAIGLLRSALAASADMNRFRPVLVEALYEIKRYDAAWKEVERCRAAGVAVPPDLIRKLAHDSGKPQSALRNRSTSHFRLDMDVCVS